MKYLVSNLFYFENWLLKHTLCNFTSTFELNLLSWTTEFQEKSGFYGFYRFYGDLPDTHLGAGTHPFRPMDWSKGSSHEKKIRKKNEILKLRFGWIRPLILADEPYSKNRYTCENFIFRFFRTFSHQEVLHVNFSQNISVNTNMKIYQILKVSVTFQPLCLSESTPF